MKDQTVYKQSNEYTGAASSLMMVLNKLDKRFKLNKENEFDIWQKSALLPVRASSIYGLAKVAREHTPNVKVIVGDKEFTYPNYRFKSYKLKEIEEATFTSKKQYKEAEEMGISIEEKDIHIGHIRQNLEKGRPMIVRLNAATFRGGRASSNFFPVIGYNSKKFKIIDPSDGKEISLSEEDMKEALNSVKTKCKRDKRMIILEAS